MVQPQLRSDRQFDILRWSFYVYKVNGILLYLVIICDANIPICVLVQFSYL
jgi:hypothetical protein